MSYTIVYDATVALASAGEVLSALGLNVRVAEVRRGSTTSRRYNAEARTFDLPASAVITVWVDSLADLRVAAEWLGGVLAADKDDPSHVRSHGEKDGVLWRFWCVTDERRNP